MKMTINLSHEEKKALSNSITTIDLQDGCSEQCLACGVNSPKLKNTMSLEKLEEILEWGIIPDNNNNTPFFKNKKNIPILYLYNSSNPVNYSYKESNGQRVGLYDAAKIVNKYLPKTSIAISTPGWKPDSFREENLIALLEDETIKKLLNYSIKTDGKIARNDFDNLLKKHGVENISIEEFHNGLFDEFMKNSRYITRLKSNIHAVKEKIKFFPIFYTDTSNLPKHNRKYVPLFYENTLLTLKKHIINSFNINPNKLDCIDYSGIGRAISEFGLSPMIFNKQLMDLENGIIKGQSPNLYDMEFDQVKPYAQITCNGKISIHLDSTHYALYCNATSSNLLRHIAGYYQKEGNKEQSRRYNVFAGLQGRKIIE